MRPDGRHPPPPGAARNIARRAARADRHVRGQSGAQKHRRRFARRRQRAAMGDRCLQPRLCQPAADRRHARRSLWAPPHIRARHRAVYARHADMRAGTHGGDPDRRTHRQRPRRRFRAAHVIGAAHHRLSGAGAARTCARRMGELQWCGLRDRTDRRRLAGRCDRLAQHFLHDASGVHRRPADHLPRGRRKRRAARAQARSARAGARDCRPCRLCIRRDRGLALGLDLTAAPRGRCRGIRCAGPFRVGGNAHARPAAAARLPAPAGVLGRARRRRPHDLRHVRAAVYHAPLFPDRARRQPLRRRPRTAADVGIIRDRFAAGRAS